MLVHVNSPYALDQISYCGKIEKAQAVDMQKTIAFQDPLL